MLFVRQSFCFAKISYKYVETNFRCMYFDETRCQKVEIGSVL